MQQPVGSVTIVPAFDSNSPRYRCWCCGCCHTTTCAIVIAVLELLGLTANLVFGIVAISQHSNARTISVNAPVAIVWFLVGVLVVGLMLYGVIKEHAVYLIPHLVCQVISIIFIVAYCVVLGLAVAAAASGIEIKTESDVAEANVKNAVIIASIVGIVAIIIVLFVEIGFFVNILKCYRYLKAKAIAARMSADVVAIQYPQVVPQQQPYNPNYDSGVYAGEQPLV